MTARPASEKPQVAIVYHFFAHYREPVMRELLQSPRYRYLLVGDTKDPEGSIKESALPESDRFIPAPCRRTRGGLYVQKNLMRLALRRDVQAILFLGNPYFVSVWPAAIAARLTGKRVLFWAHGWIRHETGRKAKIRNLFYRLAHGMLLYGHYAKNIGIQEGFKPETLYVIYNSLDVEAQKPARAQVTEERIRQIRRECFAQPDLPLLICTTRITKVRRLDLLLDAMRILKAQGHEVNLLLVGDGPERATLETTAGENGLSVRFYGECYDEATLAELIMAANVTVAPGKVGLTAMHSLAYGTPVITHDDAGDQMPEWEAIVEGKTGGFFKKNDSADLARAIGEWTPTAYPSETVRAQCYDIIDRFYNPAFQRLAIDRAVAGEPADDLFWMKK